ncbi:hypothetical protein G6F56_012960 [Rhizopus delemar]|nr:hypothetical protein G6F56_012960 [Rhizopus delemar]
MSLRRLTNRIHIVLDFASENDKHYLLNHDINRQCWSNATPPLFQLEELVKWNDDIGDNENDETEASDTDEEFIDTNEQETEQVDDSFDQFFGYV